MVPGAPIDFGSWAVGREVARAFLGRARLTGALAPSLERMQTLRAWWASAARSTARDSSTIAR